MDSSNDTLSSTKQTCIVKPIDDISLYYTGEKVENQGKTYFVLNANELIDQFGDDKNAIWGKKTEPTLIRKAIVGEKIITYADNEKGERVEESNETALKGQYVFQNLNNPDDTYIPQDKDIIKEYDIESSDSIGDEFKPFVRKSKPSKILLEIIKVPTVVIIKSRGDFTQFLEEGATLKLEDNGKKQEVVGINHGGFQAWSLTDQDGNII